MKNTITLRKIDIYQIFFAVNLVISFLINPYYPETDFFRAYDFRDLWIYVLSFSAIIIFDASFKRAVTNKKLITWGVFISMFLAFFLMIGPSFTETGEIEYVRNQLFKSMLMFVSYSISLWYFILVLYDLVDNYLLKREATIVSNRLISRYVALMRKKPFITTFVTLLVIYLPFALAVYPADFMGDVDDQLAQGFNLSSYNHYGLDYASFKLDNHHPVIHTLFVTYCVKFGKMLFNSYSAGIFIYAALQCIFMIFCFSYVAGIFVEKKASDIQLLFVPVYAVLGNHFLRYMFLTSKDVIYAGFLLIFISELFYMISENKLRKMFFVSVLGSLAFRKDAVYLIIIVLAFMLAANIYSRKKIMFILVLVLSVHIIWNNIFLPAMGVHSGSKREIFSVPFQMTARYVRDCGNEVTEEERAAIDAVLEYDNLAKVYDPIHSSPVKNTYREDSTKADLINYFKVFTTMFFKHPEVYMYSLFQFKLNMLYPARFSQAIYSYENSATIMNEANELLSELGFDFGYPDSKVLKIWRKVASVLERNWSALPFVRVLNSAATYVCTTLLLAIYIIIKKNKEAFCMITPALVVLLLCIAGPRSSIHYRYYFPLVVTLPFMIIYVFDMIKEKVEHVSINS